MIRPVRYPLAALLLLAMIPVVHAAAAWTGGRGIGNGGAYLSASFPATPSLSWKSYRGDAFAGREPSDAMVAGKRMILAFGKTLAAVSTDTGELLWTQELSCAPVGDLLFLDDQVIVALANGRVLACNPADGAMIWDRKFNAKLTCGPSFTDEVLAVSTDSNNIGVLARKTGQTLAMVSAETQIEASPLQLGKAILLFQTNGKIRRIEGGATRWSATLKGEIHQNPVTNGQLILAQTASAVYALNTASATLPFRWVYACPRLVGSPSIGAGLVYLVTSDSQLHAVDAVTGKERWGERGVRLPSPPTGSPLVVGDRVFVRMKYGLLAAYDREKGMQTWAYRVPTAGADPIIGLPAVDNGNLYFGASDGAIYCLSGAMPDIDPPLFRNVLPTKAGADFSPTRPLEYVGAVVDDEGSGVQADSVTLALDGTDLTRQLQYDAATGYRFAWLTPPFTPEPGMHVLKMTARDQRGNAGTYVANFYVGNTATAERVPVAINGEFLPRQLRVCPGTIVEWVNQAGGVRTVVADDGTFASDTQYPNGIPDGGRWVWVVPADAKPGTQYPYHCRLRGEAGTARAPGPGLSGVLEVVDPRQALPGLPAAGPEGLPAFPQPEFLQ